MLSEGLCCIRTRPEVLYGPVDILVQIDNIVCLVLEKNNVNQL